MNTHNPQNTDSVDPSTGQFVDPLFAIFIAAAVSETIVPWTKGAWDEVGFFNICVVFLGFINILLSWFGYHKSVIRKPIKGSIRFIVTVVLLPLYMLTIILYQSKFLDIVIIYAAIFFLWSCWEHLKNIEHGVGSGFLKIVFRYYNIVMYLTLFILIAVDHTPQEYLNVWCVKYVNEISLCLLVFSIFSLRITKSVGKDGSPAAKIKAEIMNLFFGNRSN